MCLLLKKLEAYGFKSFADRTEVEFGQGITAIVGPNGSGKSNISDAIRWALGEQSIKTLRGTKMEDVIFSGSAGRKPLGIAEVSLTFDNSDGILPIDFNEVIITRRVFRSGEGEYYINKTQCRLKDIHELLADTGLGRDAMAVISQNRVDEILNTRAEERRLIFEEVAGITKYKQRKKEALRKLDETTQNLTRVTDITTEIETQLGPMAESAEKTGQYNELHENLVKCQVALLTNKLNNAEKMVESADLQRSAINDEEIGNSTKLSLKETERERIAGEMVLLEEQLTQLSHNLNQANTDLERLDGKIGVLAERITQSKDSEQRIAEEAAKAQRQKNEFAQKIAELNKQLSDKEEEKRQFDILLARQTEEQQQTLGRIAELECQIENQKEKTFDYLHELVSERNQLAIAGKDLTRQKSHHENICREREEYLAQLKADKTLEEQAATERLQLQQQITELQNNATEYSLEKEKFEISLQQKIQSEKQLAVKLNELSSRRRILMNMQQEYEGFGRGIKSVLKSTQEWRGGICGAVAEIIAVPERYVVAIEIALGAALQHIITKDERTAKQAIEFLKINHLGRVTFLPLNTIQVKTPRDTENTAARAAGAHGFAAGLVSCPKEYRTVIEFLLGRTIVVENMDDALRIAKQAQFQVRIVTLDGEILHPGGSITGGSAHRKDAGFLGRSSEIDSLKGKIDESTQQVADLNRVIEAEQREVTQLNSVLADLQQQRQDIEVKNAETVVRMEKIIADIKRVEFGIQTLDDELVSATNEISRLQELISQLEGTIIRLENRDVEHKEQSEVHQLQMKELVDKKEQNINALTESRIAITALQQEIQAIRTNCLELKQYQDSVSNQMQALLEEGAALLRKISEASDEIELAKASRVSIAQQKVVYEKQNQELYAEKMRLIAASQQAEKEIKELRRRLNDLQSRLHEIELIATKYGYEVEYCTTQLLEQYGMTVEQARDICQVASRKDLADSINELEEKIAELGPINPNAIDEYTRLKERYDFLQEQYNDLVSAQDYLASVIRDIDQTMGKQFNQAFAQINEYFGETFTRLFGGGKAYLQLAEPENVLDTGIEIFVQPPGKKQQNLALLSGGERALTVIALLFSFLRYRPAPFSVVDEIDAALDEANLRRFSDFLRDYAQKTQFIVVTHRKGTMEVADVMHGVTIEESGVSRLLSVKLAEKVS